MMPYKIVNISKTRVKVVNVDKNTVKAKSTTPSKAKKMIRLLEYIDNVGRNKNKVFPK